MTIVQRTMDAANFFNTFHLQSNALSLCSLASTPKTTVLPACPLSAIVSLKRSVLRKDSRSMAFFDSTKRERHLSKQLANERTAKRTAFVSRLCDMSRDQLDKKPQLGWRWGWGTTDSKLQGWRGFFVDFKFSTGPGHVFEVRLHLATSTRLGIFLKKEIFFSVFEKNTRPNVAYSNRFCLTTRKRN